MKKRDLITLDFKKANRLQVRNEQVLNFAFSQDNKQIISAEKDETIYVWNLDTGLSVHKLEGLFQDFIFFGFNSETKNIISAEMTEKL